MKMAALRVPKLPTMPRLGLAAFRRRIVFHSVFVLLGLATLALAVTLLAEEKQRSRERYEQGFKKTLTEVAAQLRHPAGQLALLNAGPAVMATSAPRSSPEASTLRTPLLLPFGAIDFDDPSKARQAVEMSGCALRYPDGASLCVAVGNNAFAGGFIYLVGELDMTAPVARERAALDLHGVHRAVVEVKVRGAVEQWVAPFELTNETTRGLPVQVASKGRLTGFASASEVLEARARPARDFRGWLWQEGPCLEAKGFTTNATNATTDPTPDCKRRTLYSIRLPLEAFKEALFTKPAPPWPPADLPDIEVRVQVRGPTRGVGPQVALFDSRSPGATALFSLGELAQGLTAGETLSIERLGQPQRMVARLRGRDDGVEAATPWLLRLIDLLPVETTVKNAAVKAQTEVRTASGSYLLSLQGELANVDRHLGATATRLAWFVGAMLAAIALAWLFIELGLVRRVAVLTQRAAALTHHMTQDVTTGMTTERLGELDVSDLRGKDELGILAGSLADLMARVKDNLRREHIRAAQERDMWHAVGHEIMSPLQSLMVLHGAPSDASHRYVQRMQQAVRVLYGAASPSEALAAAPVQLASLDLLAFAQHVAGNAHFAGIEQVVLKPVLQPVLKPVLQEPSHERAGVGAGTWLVHADEYSLEDVVTHVLRNAEQHRTPGTPIVLRLDASSDDAMLHLAIHNQGPAINAALMDKIFEYGVSDKSAAQGTGSPSETRGQGLFVARTYMAKMGGTIEARNVAGGVELRLRLPRVASA